MIVQPDFCDHWKTRMFIELLGGDESAPLYLIRLWGHCQIRKAWKFESLPQEAVKAICKFSGNPSDLESAMQKCGFVKRDGSAIECLKWDEYNAALIQAWENGKKGGRKKGSKNKPKNNPSETQEEPKNNPGETQQKPLGIPRAADGLPTGYPIGDEISYRAKAERIAQSSPGKDSVDASRQTQDGTPTASDGLLFKKEDFDLHSKEKNQSGAPHRSAQSDDWKLTDDEIKAMELEALAKAKATPVKRDPMQATPEFDPWMVEFRRVWNATPGTTKLTGRVSNSVKDAIWARRSDPWFEENWRVALSMFPLPYFEKCGQLIGITKFFTEPNFIENVVDGKWQVDYGAIMAQPKPDLKTSQATAMLSDLEKYLAGNSAGATSTQRLITNGQ